MLKRRRGRGVNIVVKGQIKRRRGRGMDIVVKRQIC